MTTFCRIGSSRATAQVLCYFFTLLHKSSAILGANHTWLGGLLLRFMSREETLRGAIVAFDDAVDNDDVVDNDVGVDQEKGEDNELGDGSTYPLPYPSTLTWNSISIKTFSRVSLDIKLG